MTQAKVISADSHVMEPADFWETRLDQKYRDNAPRVVPKRNGKGYVFIAPEVNPFPVAGGFAAGDVNSMITGFLVKCVSRFTESRHGLPIHRPGAAVIGVGATVVRHQITGAR